MAKQTKSIKTQSIASLDSYIKQVISGKKSFKNVFQSISKMILGDQKKIKKVIVNGRTTYNLISSEQKRSK